MFSLSAPLSLSEELKTMLELKPSFPMPIPDVEEALTSLGKHCISWNDFHTLTSFPTATGVCVRYYVLVKDVTVNRGELYMS
jgi:hypothetical protein